MPTPSLQTAEALGAAWQARDEASLVQAKATGAPAKDAAPDPVASTRRSVWSKVMRVARDVTIGMAFITAIPLTVVGLAGRMLFLVDAPMRERIVSANRLRALREPVDPSVTREAAGAALHRLRPMKSADGFVVRPVELKKAPWTDVRLTASQFAGMQSKWWNGPDAKQIVAAAATGLPEADRAWLAQLAQADLWRDFDLVTKAREADVVGQSFVTPFPVDGTVDRMPIPSYLESRALAHAGVARAAHYVSIGDPAQAEQILRSVVSLGFILIDDGVGPLDALYGRLMVDTGRDGLHQLYQTGYHPERLAATEPAQAPLRQQRPTAPRVSVAEAQADAMMHLSDASLPRTIRLQELQRLRRAGCGSVASVIFGPTSEQEAAVARAKATLIRNDAERAQIELIERSLSRGPSQTARDILPYKVIEGAGLMASTVTGNPRIASCANAIMGTF